MAKKKPEPVPAPSTPVRRRRVIVAPSHQTLSLAEMNELKRATDKARFLVALEANVGIVSYAAESAGVPRRTVYEWIDADPEFARCVREVDNKQLDFVERRLLENIKNNDTRAITFYLSTKGRVRGYTTRVEMTTPLDMPIRAEVTVNTDEARSEMGDKAMARALNSIMKTNPGAFTEASRIAIHNGQVDKA